MRRWRDADRMSGQLKMFLPTVLLPLRRLPAFEPWILPREK
jgi:hypothetical protein